MSQLPFSVAFLAIPGFSMMALSAAVEPLRSVNRLLGERRYSWFVAARKTGLIAAGNGLEIAAGHRLDQAPDSDFTVVVASLGIEHDRDRQTLDWLRRRRAGGRLIGAVSNGPLILARAGLLDGHRATIHWEMQRKLAEECPQVEVCADLYCIDRGVFTAAGGSAAMDMMLALISEREGREVAADVAEQFLHGPIRASTAMQRQDVRWRYQVNDRRLVTAIRLMEEQQETPIRIARLAAMVGLSSRQLGRLFEASLAQSPSDLYMQIRLRNARRQLLHSTASLDEIAERCGFSSQAHFSRAYKRWSGETPATTRRRPSNDV